MIDSDFAIGFKQGQAHGKQIMFEKIEDIKAEIRKLHPVKRGDNDYANGVYDGECWVIDKALYIIDKHISGKEGE